MSKTHKICEYTVNGDGAFPLDMLRHDRSWPSDQEAVQQIEKAQFHTRAIRLETLERGPDEARWASMGWKVSNIRRY